MAFQVLGFVTYFLLSLNFEAVCEQGRKAIFLKEINCE